ncbi:GNAT family N-acetyltransferase [Halopiger goleimassiliensis]|uniref:GNAT family N-acetyltransferase n=1 Tax=Halopiger goleimassiliensis TaxID=1293048 RepID=UPI000678187B|nr:GNAT family N-acetyltransferase [Halopiger goleimassiliensis]
MFPETIEREAITLRRFDDERVDPFELYALFAANREEAAEVFAYVPQEPYETVKDAVDRLESAASAWDDGEEAQYAVYTHDDALAGYTGLIPEWDRRMGRIGFILGKPYWGNGYAEDCARALLEVAFERLDLEVVAFDHAEGNERSKRVLERIVDAAGGQYDGVLRNWLPVGEEVPDHHRYTVTQEQYRSSRDGA